MQLKDFIKETLTEILAGVKESQETAKLNGGIVAASGYKDEEYLHKRLEDGTNTYHAIRDVKFEVGLTIDESAGAKGKIGVIAGFFNLGGSAESTSGKKAITSVTFSVPLAFPRPDLDDHK